MLVSHRKEFIYLKTIKTASTSIECYFEEYCFQEDTYIFSHARKESISKFGIVGYRGRLSTGYEFYNHMSALELKSRINDKIWDNYFKFCVVRNPYTRLVSLFHMELNLLGLQINDRNKLKTTFSNWLTMRYEWDYSSSRFFMINQEICMNAFIKYENLKEDLKSICHKLKIPFQESKLPHLKEGRYQKNYFDYYDESTIDLVKKFCSFELDLFNYSFPE